MKNGYTPNDQESIISSLHKKGVLDNLKAYLRSDIYTKLKSEEQINNIHSNSNLNIEKVLARNNISPLNNNYLSNINSSSSSNNKHSRLTTSLIIDYMKKNNMSYSLSVFLPESKRISSDEPYLETEMAQICKISYDKLEKSGEVSFLSQLVNQILSTNDKLITSISTQTESDLLKDCNHVPSMEEKLKEIDKKYSKLNFDSLMPAKAMEEKMIKFERELEIRLKSDYERELQRIKDSEFTLIRIDENKKYMKKIEDIREEYEREYREKLEHLKKRESDANARINLREKELETSLYENRQKFLNELQMIKLREEELKTKYENQNNNLKFEEDKLKMLQKDSTNIRESSLKKIKDEIDQFKIDYERNFELEKSEMRKTKLELEEKIVKNSFLNEKIQNYENGIKLLKEENEKYLNKTESLEKSLHILKRDNEMLREELKILADNEKRSSNSLSKREIESSHLKEENKILRENIEEQKRRYEERKIEQNILIENIKKQLDDNLLRLNKTKLDHEEEIERLKKSYNNLIEKEKDSNEQKFKELERKSKNYSENDTGGEKLLNRNITNLLKSHYQRNHLHSPQNDRLKTLHKLEKEAEDLKNEVKISLHSKIGKEKDSQTMNLVYKDLYEKLYENVQYKNAMDLVMRGNQGYSQTNIQTGNTSGQQYNSDNRQIITNDSKDTFIGTGNQANLNDFHNKQIVEKLENKITQEETHNLIENKTLTSNQQNIERTQIINEHKIINNNIKDSSINIMKNNIQDAHQIIINSNIDKIKTENASNNLKDKFVEDASIPSSPHKYTQEEDISPIIKQEFQPTILNDNKLPTPSIISGNSLPNKETPSIPLTKLKSKEIISEQDSNQDFSVANLTSSNEWDFDSNRKEKEKEKDKNLNNSTEKSRNIKNEFKNPLTSKEVPSKSNVALIEESQNLKDSIRSKLKTGSIKEESEESHNISQILEDKKSHSISESRDLTRQSFNKFSNVNYDLDKNEIEEDIKVDAESDNYEYDFVEDTDGLEKRGSVDLDAVKNASLNFKDSNKNLTMNITKSLYKSQSLDKQIEKLLQSKSAIEENIIEDISVDNSKREAINSTKSNRIEEDSNLKYNDYYQSANVNIAVSSDNNIIKNIIRENSKESSIKDSLKLYESKTSEIKEEICQSNNEEDDGYIPYDHNEEDY